MKDSILHGIAGIILMIAASVYLEAFLLTLIAVTVSSPFLIPEITKNVQVLSGAGAVISVVAFGIGLHLVNENLHVVVRLFSGLFGVAVLISGAIIVLSVALGNIAGTVVGLIFVVLGIAFIDYGFKLKVMPVTAKLIAKV